MRKKPCLPGLLITAIFCASTLAGDAPPVSEIDDTDPSIIYSRGNDTSGGPIADWNTYQGPEDYNRTEHSSRFKRSGGTFQGASVCINFTGTGITWIGKKGPNYGMATYAIDGGSPQTFDGYSPKKIDQNPNVTISGLPSESHVLQISLLAEKDKASTDYYQTIDAFKIDGSPLPPSAGTVAGYDSAELSLTGSWDHGGDNPGDLSGGHCWSSAAHSTLSWTFTGSLVEVFGRPDLENGNLQVSIDGQDIATVDGNFGNVDDDSLNSVMLFAHRLLSGKHTIKLEVTGTHDKNATDSCVQVDEFVAFP